MRRCTRTGIPSPSPDDLCMGALPRGAECHTLVVVMGKGKVVEIEPDPEMYCEHRLEIVRLAVTEQT